MLKNNMSFFVYLPWQSSSNYFKDNITSNFKVKLPTYLQFHKKIMEVALVEISDVPPLKNINSYFAKKPSKVFVHCDIVESQIYGNSFIPLLRLVHFSENDSLTHVTYDSPHYVPISRSAISIIQIQLLDDQQKLLDLETSPSEKLLLTLHFREKNFFLFKMFQQQSKDVVSEEKQFHHPCGIIVAC